MGVGVGPMTTVAVTREIVTIPGVDTHQVAADSAQLDPDAE